MNRSIVVKLEDIKKPIQHIKTILRGLSNSKVDFISQNFRLFDIRYGNDSESPLMNQLYIAVIGHDHSLTSNG
jgi:hypothetical protein